MRRADRLFQLVQILRNKRLVTARELAYTDSPGQTLGDFVRLMQSEGY